MATKNYGTLQDKNGNNLLPVGIETINNANGNALKFADGTMICTKIVTWTGTCNTAWGSFYDTPSIALGDYASSFISAPTISVNTIGNNAGLVESVFNTSKTSFGECWVCRASMYENITYTLHCIAIGRWK